MKNLSHANIAEERSTKSWGEQGGSSATTTSAHIVLSRTDNHRNREIWARDYYEKTDLRYNKQAYKDLDAEIQQYEDYYQVQPVFVYPKRFKAVMKQPGCTANILETGWVPGEPFQIMGANNPTHEYEYTEIGGF